MKKYLALVSALLVACFALAPLAYAAPLGDAQEPKEITREEAAKKYPPPQGGKYPQAVALPTTAGGFFQSPYSSRHYDLRKVNHGALILDEGVNKVFVKP